MTAPFFTTNDNDLTQLEGLYIQERNPPAIVAGVNLAGVGIAGQAVRGPVNRAIQITSEGQFLAIFGGADQTANGQGGAPVNLLWQAMLNKPYGTLYCVRAAAAGAVAASFEVNSAAAHAGTNIANIIAANVGAWGNNVKYKVENATDGNVNHWNLRLSYLGNEVVYPNLDTSTGNDNTATVLAADTAAFTNWITITKLGDGRPVNNTANTDGADANGFVALGQVVAGYVSTPGTDGAIADTDFTGTNGPMEILAAQAGVAVAFVAERSSASIKTKWATLAASAVDRMFVIGPDDQTVTAAAAETDAGLNQSDRLIYCYGHVYTQNPNTGSNLLVRPEPWMASILSQTDVDVHPGDEDNKKYTAGIVDLYNTSLSRQDYINLKAAGICAFEKDNGFAFVSGVTTSLEGGKQEITRRRETDYLQLSIAAQLKYSAKKKNTASRRKANAALIQGFLNDLKKQERIVADFSVDTEVLNTPTQRAAGLEKIFLRVKLISHMLYLDLVTQIGTSVVITQLN